MIEDHEEAPEDLLERAWRIRLADPVEARALRRRAPDGPAATVLDGFLAWREKHLDAALQRIVQVIDEDDLGPVWLDRARALEAVVLIDIGLFDEAVAVQMRRLQDPFVAGRPINLAACVHDLAVAMQHTDPEQALRYYGEALTLARDLRIGALKAPGPNPELASLEALAIVNIHELCTRLGTPVPPGTPTLQDAEEHARRTWPDLADSIRAQRVRALVGAGWMERARRLARALPEAVTLRDAASAADVARAQATVLAADGRTAEAVAVLRVTSDRLPPAMAADLLGELVDIHEAAGEADEALQAAKARLVLVLDLHADTATSTARALGVWYRTRQASEQTKAASRLVEELHHRIERIDLDRSRLEERLSKDDLTGLYNRRHLFATARSLPAGRHEVAVLDIDGFKGVNDRAGHLAGDDALRHVADRLRDVARPGDICCRFGGDEFVVVRPAGGAASLADDLRALTLVEAGDANPDVCISVGVSTFSPEDVEAGLARADQAMYEVKRLGGRDVGLGQD